MSKIKFVNLHAHTGYSIGDGMGMPHKHFDFAVSNGLDAHAITDHGNMSALAQAHFHEQKLRKSGKSFKYIKGIEAYYIPSQSEWNQLKQEIREENEEMKGKKEIDDEETGTVVENESETKSGFNDKKKLLRKRSHLVLLAKTDKGLENLFKLTSKSFQGERFYFYPRMDDSLLRKHSEGIIASSACVDKDAVVQTNFGLMTLEKVHELFNNGEELYITSYNEKEKRIEFKKITNSVNTNPCATVVKLNLKNGKQIKLTPDHKVFTNFGWLRADEISKKEGVKVLSLR